MQKSVSFLGHVVSVEGIATDPKKIEAVLEWPVPTSVKKVRSFLNWLSLLWERKNCWKVMWFDMLSVNDDLDW